LLGGAQEVAFAPLARDQSAKIVWKQILAGAYPKDVVLVNAIRDLSVPHRPASQLIGVATLGKEYVSAA
jgi:hypothetical protein